MWYDMTKNKNVEKRDADMRPHFDMEKQKVCMREENFQKMSYEEYLYNPDISWMELADMIKIPDILYKYRSFYGDDGKENEFWQSNIKGEFHLSFACKFEDVNDCRPYIDRMEVVNILNEKLCAMGIEKAVVDIAMDSFKEEFNKNDIEKIVENYRSQVRIGCFTDSYKNEKMWNKYGDMGRGFCIEYDTKKSDLFTSLTFPVLYIGENYNMSQAYAYSLLLNWIGQAKGISAEKQLERHGKIWGQLIKKAYIPIFLKNSETWSFEKEYRMFIRKHQTTFKGSLKMEDVVDDNGNINLRKSVKSIYLGKNFDRNKNAKKIYETISNIQRAKNNEVFNIYKLNEYYEKEKIEVF